MCTQQDMDLKYFWRESCFNIFGGKAVRNLMGKCNLKLNFVETSNLHVKKEQCHVFSIVNKHKSLQDVLIT